MIPTLSMTTGHNDNPFSATTAADEDSMMVSTIAPNLQFLAQQGDNVYSVNMGLTKGIFHDSTGDNYTDINLSATAQMVLNARNAVDLSAGYFEGHEDRGTGATQGVGSVIVGPTEYEDTTLGGVYTFGAPSAKMRLEFSADYLDKSFDPNHPFLGNTVSQRDRENLSAGARLLYAVSADTDVTAEIRNTDIDYNTRNAYDGSELAYFVGLEWQATGKTSGFVKAGLTDKELDTGAEDDFFSWGAGVEWQPRTYSTVTLETSRAAEETPSLGFYIEAATYAVSWNHAWNEKVSTDLGYNLRQEEYVGSLQDDDTDSLNAKVTYAFDRWLDIGLGWEYTDKSSSVSALDFDRNQIVLSLDLSL